MQFLMLVNATRDLDAGPMPAEKHIGAMSSSHEDLARAGTRLDASGQPRSKGWRIEHSGEQRSFVDGPFAETKELIAGYEIPDQQHGSRPRDGHTQRTKKGDAMPSHGRP